MQSSIHFCNMFPWLWLIGSLALVHWLFVSSRDYCDISLDSWISGFFGFCVSAFLVPWLCWLCFALAGSAFRGSLFSQNDIWYSIRRFINVVVAVFQENQWYVTHNFLPLLTMYPPRLNKSICNLVAISMLTPSGPTVLAHTASLCVIQSNAPMQAKLDPQYDEVWDQEIGFLWPHWLKLLHLGSKTSLTTIGWFWSFLMECPSFRRHHICMDWNLQESLICVFL